MARASIKNMMFYGFHGVYEYEREQGQKFYLDVTAETKDDKVVETDDIKDGVDIAAVYDVVKDVTENKRFTLTTPSVQVPCMASAVSSARS